MNVRRLRSDRPAPTTQTSFRTVQAGGLDVHYREAGPVGTLPVLLLHGFPSASHMFRDLIPELARSHRVIAPDLPGFGQTERPERGDFDYTFERLTDVIEGFVDALGLERFAVYVFDYGAPVGLRLALRRPDAIAALISQNGNAYAEGLSDGWNPIRTYWADPSQENRDALRGLLSAETTRWQYTHGTPDAALVSPDGYTLDQAYLDRPGVDEIQLDLFRDYASNVELYPRFQAYFRERTPPTLAVWGDKDPFFLPPGAEAFRRDNPDAEVRFYDTGHFALETHAREIGGAILDFLARKA